MNIWNMCGVALLVAFCAMTVGRAGAQTFPFISIIGCVSIFAYALIRYSSPISYINELAARSGISEYIFLILKVLAVGYGVGICADVCRDMGESRIASGVELLGRVEIILLCLPLLSEIMELAIGMAGQ